MTRILHILTEPGHALADEIILQQSRGPQTEVMVVDLSKPEPDYEDLLAKIFEADSIQVW